MSVHTCMRVCEFCARMFACCYCACVFCSCVHTILAYACGCGIGHSMQICSLRVFFGNETFDWPEFDGSHGSGTDGFVILSSIVPDSSILIHYVDLVSVFKSTYVVTQHRQHIMDLYSFYRRISLVLVVERSMLGTISSRFRICDKIATTLDWFRFTHRQLPWNSAFSWYFRISNNRANGMRGVMMKCAVCISVVRLFAQSVRVMGTLMDCSNWTIASFAEKKKSFFSHC